MPVPVSWVLAQPDLAISLRGGDSGVSRTIDLVITTELEDPFRWLAGGELVLTTGTRLPKFPAGRAAYLRGLNQRGVAAMGFGIGPLYPEIPPDLVSAADEIGIPLFEVPQPTPFVAIARRVHERAAQVQFDALQRAARAQPRLTRALVRSGARAIVRELATSLRATVLVIDSGGRVTDAHPDAPDEAMLETVHETLAAESAATARGVRIDQTGRSITHQRIGVGGRVHGDLVVVASGALSDVDQILLGHANSLLALDFEKPARLWEAQHRLNSTVLGLLLSSETDMTPAWTQLAQAADAAGRIRVLAADCDSSQAVDDVRTTAENLAVRGGHPLFLHVRDRRVLVALPGVAAVAFARELATDLAPGSAVRCGLSGEHPLHELVAAAEAAELSASAAERGGAPAEFGTLTGRSLLSFDATRRVLDTMAHTVLAPLADHDASHNTDLVESLRAYLEANGQWESAANALNIHRHTLRKRIATIADLLGCNLDSARVRAELLLALLARGS